MAVVVRFGAVPDSEDRCVGCGKPGVPAGRARFPVACEGPPLLVLHANSGPRPLEDDEGSSSRGRLAQARAWARAPAAGASSSAGCRGRVSVSRCRWRRGPRGGQWAAPGRGRTTRGFHRLGWAPRPWPLFFLHTLLGSPSGLDTGPGGACASRGLDNECGRRRPRQAQTNTATERSSHRAYARRRSWTPRAPSSARPLG